MTTTFTSIAEAHSHYGFPGLNNRKYTFDKDGMIRVYKTGDSFVDDVIKKNSIICFFKYKDDRYFTQHPPAYKAFEKSLKSHRPL